MVCRVPHRPPGTNSGADAWSALPTLVAALFTAAAAARRAARADDLRSAGVCEELAAERPCTTAAAAAKIAPLDMGAAVGMSAPAAAMMPETVALSNAGKDRSQADSSWRAADHLFEPHCIPWLPKQWP